MMNAILMAVVRFFETVVNYSLAAVVLAVVVVGAVAACRWLANTADANGSYGRAVRALRRGSGSMALLGALAVVCLLAGIALTAATR
jgi:hypothetical protein